MKNIILNASLILILSSCSHHSNRRPASSELNPPALDHLLEASDRILQDIESYEFGQVCVPYLKELELQIDSLDLKKFPREEVLRDAEAIAKNSWGIRSTLHRRLSEFSKECILQIQSTFRQFRFIEDYLLEISRRVTHLTPADLDFQKQPIPIKDNGVDYYNFYSSRETKFKSGDLFVTRGVSFLSSMIARLGQRPTQFSHTVMAYEDPSTKKMQTIESYVGIGVAFYDMDFALKNENARIIWLRSKDENLGLNAADMMGKLVKERIAAKNPIKYDYLLDFDDSKTMSCAEVSQVAFQLSSGGSFNIPLYPNSLSNSNSITQRLQLKEGKTYEPGDMEIDPRFEIVGEFRDLRLTRDSRQKDAIMTALFQWMEQKGYVLKDNLKSKMAGGFIYNARRTFLWPLVRRILGVDNFSKEIPRNMLKTVTLVNELGEVLLKEIKKRDNEYEIKHGIPMSYMDFYRVLEELRVQDLSLFENKKTRKKALFHKYINPFK